MYCQKNGQNREQPERMDCSGNVCSQESLLSTNQRKELDSAGVEQQESVESILDQIKAGKLEASTPILTSVCTKKNLICIKAEQVKLLQRFAEDMEGKKGFETLRTRPVNLLVAGTKGKSSGEAVNYGKNDDCLNCEVVVKVFLNGARSEVGKSVSVCVSVVNRDDDKQNVLEGDDKQHVPENRKLVVSIYLKHPNKEKPYRKDFTMDFCPKLEEREKGLLKLISKEKLDDYLADDGSVTFGVSVILLGSNAHTEE